MCAWTSRRFSGPVRVERVAEGRLVGGRHRRLERGRQQRPACSSEAPSGSSSAARRADRGEHARRPRHAGPGEVEERRARRRATCSCVLASSARDRASRCRRRSARGRRGPCAGAAVEVPRGVGGGDRRAQRVAAEDDAAPAACARRLTTTRRSSTATRMPQSRAKPVVGVGARLKVLRGLRLLADPAQVVVEDRLRRGRADRAPSGPRAAFSRRSTTRPASRRAPSTMSWAIGDDMPAPAEVPGSSTSTFFAERGSDLDDADAVELPRRAGARRSPHGRRSVRRPGRARRRAARRSALPPPSALRRLRRSGCRARRHRRARPAPAW